MSPDHIITLDHYELKRERIGRVIYFEATIAEIVQISAATRWDPPEFGSAACRGDILLDDDEPTPENLGEFMAYAEQVETWQPIMEFD